MTVFRQRNIVIFIIISINEKLKLIRILQPPAHIITTKSRRDRKNLHKTFACYLSPWFGDSASDNLCASGCISKFRNLLTMSIWLPTHGYSSELFPDPIQLCFTSDAPKRKKKYWKGRSSLDAAWHNSSWRNLSERRSNFLESCCPNHLIW